MALIRFISPKVALLVLLFIPLTTRQALAEADSEERPPLFLGQGEQKILHLPGLLRYSLGGSVARALPLPHGLEGGPNRTGDAILIKAVTPGTGDLWVWKKDSSPEHRSIRVEKMPPDEVKPALLRALSRLQEAEVLFSGSGVILRGAVTTLPELARLGALARGYPTEVHDETEVTRDLLGRGRLRLEAWVRNAGYDGKLRVEEYGGELWLRGALGRPSEQAAAGRSARQIFPRVQYEVEALPDAAPTVHFRVYLLELRKTSFGAFGLGWPPAQEGAFRVTTSGIQDMLALDLTLQELQGDGSAHILSNPELVVRAPGEAELFAGGELPIRMASHFYENVTWKTFGLTLKLKVTHSTAEKARVDIFTEVSHLDSSIGNDKVPGLQANRMRTQVDAQYGVPLLLSGLLQEGERTNAKGLPFLRQIPVLGSLFGSEDYLNDRSELVAILVPNHAPPSAPMARIDRHYPEGPVPPPRNWISPSQERELRQSPDFPWNALR